jgi:hypothetical protein
VWRNQIPFTRGLRRFRIRFGVGDCITVAVWLLDLALSPQIWHQTSIKSSFLLSFEDAYIGIERLDEVWSIYFKNLINARGLFTKELSDVSGVQ